ncbi:hypothetical protein V6N13_048532 [Hibiscus sabdariffa]
MVRIGESIEVAIKSGKIDAGENTRKTFKKKDNEVNTMSSYNLPKNFTISTPVTRNEQGAVKKESRAPRKENEKVAFTHLPISYAELYTQLYKVDLVRPYIVVPFQPPFPAWYDEKARSDYHGGVPGHSIENCTPSKRPLVISLKPREESSSQEKGPQGIPKLVISAPTPFPFKSTKQVPWNYNAHISTQGEGGAQDVEGSHREAQPTQGEESPEKEVVNEVGHFTRSGTRLRQQKTQKHTKTRENSGQGA